MNFNLAEQLAILKAIDEVILTDNRVYEGEASFVAELAAVLKFNPEFIRDARNVSGVEAMAILKAMPSNKKRALAVLLREAAGSDGLVTDDELRLIQAILIEAGID